MAKIVSNILKNHNIKQKIVLSSWFFKRPRVLYKVVKGYFIRGILNIPYLRSLELNITPYCNMNCEMCYASKYVQADNELLSVNEYKKIWNQAKKMGAFGVNIIGGEPTIHPDLFSILSVLEPDKYLISLVTNGFAVTEDMVKEFVNLKLFRLCISLDSDQAEENDKVRGEGSYKRVMNLIDLCKKYSMPFEISFTLSKSSLKIFKRMHTFARSNNILLGVSTFSPTGRFEGRYNECLDDNDWIIIKNNFSDLRFDFSHTFKGIACPGGIEKICISPYGDVQTCAINPISFGNIRQQALKDIWESIHTFPYFHKDRLYPRCVVSWDKDYQKEYLEPIRSFKTNPVDLSHHPSILKSKKIKENE